MKAYFLQRLSEEGGVRKYVQGCYGGCGLLVMMYVLYKVIF